MVGIGQRREGATTHAGHTQDRTPWLTGGVHSVAPQLSCARGRDDRHGEFCSAAIPRERPVQISARYGDGLAGRTRGEPWTDPLQTDALDYVAGAERVPAHRGD